MSLAMVAKNKGVTAYLGTNLFIECFLAPVGTRGLRCHMKLFDYGNYTPDMAPIHLAELPLV
jgi:hypothetical protein